MLAQMSHVCTALILASLSADAGVDGDTLQRHLDGEGPLSQIAFHRVFGKMVGNKATTAWYGSTRTTGRT